MTQLLSKSKCFYESKANYVLLVMIINNYPLWVLKPCKQFTVIIYGGEIQEMNKQVGLHNSLGTHAEKNDFIRFWYSQNFRPIDALWIQMLQNRPKLKKMKVLKQLIFSWIWIFNPTTEKWYYQSISHLSDLNSKFYC